MEPIGGGHPIELYDQETKKVVVSFKEGILGPHEFNKAYEVIYKDLIENGIRVPVGVKGSYDDKVIIRLEDKNFGRAFFDFYVPANLLSGGRFVWRPIDKK